MSGGFEQMTVAKDVSAAEDISAAEDPTAVEDATAAEDPTEAGERTAPAARAEPPAELSRFSLSHPESRLAWIRPAMWLPLVVMLVVLAALWHYGAGRLPYL
ncbi:MAG: NitT/TauT family transport system permease protein, partial [Streptomyces sp.]|nr:NitT/TauT family transport system permease protein [Streptomyces sp.]